MAKNEHDGSGEADEVDAGLRRRRSAQLDVAPSVGAQEEMNTLHGARDWRRTRSLPHNGNSPRANAVSETTTSVPQSATVPMSRVRFSLDIEQSMPTDSSQFGGLKENVKAGHNAEGFTSSDRPPTSDLVPDTGRAMTMSTAGVLGAGSAPAQITFPLSPGPGSSTTWKAASTDSPRSRTRGYSPRRYLFNRSLHEQAAGSAFELESVGSSSRTVESNNPDPPASHVKKGGTKVSVAPVLDDDRHAELPPRIVKTAHASPSLPHYETWVKSRTKRAGIVSDFRATCRKLQKAILRIKLTPPSKDGRHINLDPRRKKALIDERTGKKHIGNTIRSSRYTLWNFLPRQLFAQFSKLANFYFLCVSVMQMIPTLSTTGSYTTIIPLLFFVSVSMAKEGYDDLRRYRLDKVENNSDAMILHAYKPTSEVLIGGNDVEAPTSGPKHWAKTKWKDVQVGDVVKLRRDEAAPADLVVLHVDGRNEVAYFETMALDGETNLKSKQPSPPLAQSCKTLDDLTTCAAHFVVEDPNLDLYKFEGRVTVGTETQPLTNNEIVYRGSILRNTNEVVGMVIYTGEECKTRMNASKNPRIKAPALQAVVNRVVVIIVIFVIALAIFNTAAYQVWARRRERKSWYLINAGVRFFPIFASFVIMFNTMIPLSLYVSLEIVKLFQMILMNDIDMYDEDSDTPMEARTSTINEELGQVRYVNLS
jgi:phospholipid-translocating ATPase